MTPNPLAKSRRLSRALVDLRDKAGYGQTELARRSGVKPSVISRLESPGEPGRRPNILFVRKLLDALDVPRGSAEFVQIEQFAEAAADRRWWDEPRFARMGEGQKTFALVELGATGIDEYAAGLLPGLVQTAAYARHRILAGHGDDVVAAVAGRLGRQQQLATQGTTYRLVLEEQAVRRYPVPPGVMLDQLRHLLALADEPGYSVRVVPVDAKLGDGPAPRAPFAQMAYPGDDPSIVIVDGVTDPHLVTSVDEVAEYAQLHQRLREAALSDKDSVAFIKQVAKSLAAAT
ncbi:helix-turn-helix domain-containing protein [Micromonospora zhanjiangensis]|uniref:Helix-turn-helix domain-containing protein n=1 Tax=Micromonospora zhanjiangensis TaxID=1522057 RepID=A0ABV8KKK8_9ACTN